jgi:hypothetical protein
MSQLEASHESVPTFKVLVGLPYRDNIPTNNGHQLLIHKNMSGIYDTAKGKNNASELTGTKHMII